MLINNETAIIVDDELHIRLFIKKILKSLNFNVIGEASNGNEAVDLYKSHKPDVMFIDINMPYKTGLEALEEILALDTDAKIIMLTSNSDLETVHKCAELGAIGYIRKDTPLEQMKSIILETWQDIKSGE